MGSFLWDHEPNDICYTQYHNGRPLSVALIEPCEPEPLGGFIDNDFISNHHRCHQQQQHHQRSRSLGRRFKRESYRQFHSENSCSQHCCCCCSSIRSGIHYPNTQFSTCLFSAPLAQRSFHYGSSGNGFVEKLGSSDETPSDVGNCFRSIAIDD